MKQIIKYSADEMKQVYLNWENLAKEYNGEFNLVNASTVEELADPEQRKFEFKTLFTNEELCIYAIGFTPLKIGYVFRMKKDLEFNLYPEDFTKKVGKLFGLKEHEIGDPLFDDRFIIKGNNKEFIIKMLNEGLKKFLTDNYVPVFKLERNHGALHLELNVAINELDYSQLKLLIELFKKVILTIKVH
jgi:hypothetical protein